MDLSRIYRGERPTPPETRHRGGRTATAIRLRAIALALPRIRERELLRQYRHDLFADRMAENVASLREIGRRAGLRQIELVERHPSAAGLRTLARLAQDPRQHETVRVEASRVILRMAHGPAPKLEDDEWTP